MLLIDMYHDLCMIVIMESTYTNTVLQRTISNNCLPLKLLKYKSRNQSPKDDMFEVEFEFEWKR